MQVGQISRELLGTLMGSWCLKRQLTALQDIYLIASPGMQCFADGLIRTLEGLHQGDRQGMKTLWGGSRVFEVQGLLEECLSDVLSATGLPIQALKGMHPIFTSSSPASPYSPASAVVVFYTLSLVSGCELLLIRPHGSHLICHPAEKAEYYHTIIIPDVIVINERRGCLPCS